MEPDTFMTATTEKTTPGIRRRPHRALGALGALVLGLSLAAIPARVDAATEYEIKAVYLLNLAKGISWPTSAFSDPRSPLIIGVLGSDPFGATLTRVCSGETAGGRPLKVNHSRSASGLAGCHLVFVSKSEASRTASIIASLSGRPILLVGDFSPFASRGGHLNFILTGGSVRYEINASAARATGLKIPSKIQRSGISVSGP